MTVFKPVFRITAFLAAAAGIVFNIIAYPYPAELFSYFTLQSNVLCTVMLGAAAVRRDDSGRGIFRGCCTVCITLTFLVYHFLLKPETLVPATLFDNMTNVSTLFAHYIVPALTVLDYLMFFPKGKFRLHYPLLWLCFPVAYLFYVFMYSASGGTFSIDGETASMPYFFLDSGKVGTGGTVLWICIIAAGFTALSYLLVLLDRALCRRE